jgi:hypothetical protein
MQTMSFSNDPAEQYLYARQIYRHAPNAWAGADCVERNGIRRAVCAKAKELFPEDPSPDSPKSYGKFDPAYWAVTTVKSKHTAFAPPIGVDWCGIFASWIWKETGIEVEWELQGIDPIVDGKRILGASTGPYMKGAASRIATSSVFSSIAPGDILVRRADPFHHMLVICTSWEDSPGTFCVLQGNSVTSPKTQSLVSRAIVRGVSHSQYFYYSLDSVTSPTKHYGTNIPGWR